MLKKQAELEMKRFYEFQSIKRVNSLHSDKYFITIEAIHHIVTLITWHNEYVATGYQESSLKTKQKKIKVSLKNRVTILLLTSICH